MDFRWKNRGGGLPQVQPNFVDPQGVRATVAQQQMAGYRPNPQTNMQGYSGAPTRAPMVGNPGSGEGYQFDASGIDAFNEKKRKLEQLKAQLAEVDAQIAEVQRQDVEQDVAAKLASIGELGLYQQLLSQRQNAETTKRSAAQGVENELYNAAKFIPALDGSDEERRAAMGAIQAALDKAAARGDNSVKDLKVYKELESAVKAPRGSTVAAKINELETRLWSEYERQGYVDDATYKELVDYVAANEGSDKAQRGQQVAARYKAHTKTTNNKAAREKAEAEAEYKKWERMTPFQAENRWRELSDAGHPIVKYFELRAGTAKPTRRAR